MKKGKSFVRRTGFTMVEVLVVVGIIAILIAALLPFLGGSTESANCVKCKNNMKNLALAVISCAQADDVYGHFTAAGYYRTLEIHLGKSRGSRRYYYPHRPWISNKGDIRTLNSTVNTVYMGEKAHFTDLEEGYQIAITNGSIWTATGRSYEVYKCPVHAREFKKKNGRAPGWSFMMNQEFGYDRAEGKATGFHGSSIHNKITVATGTSGKREDGSASRGHDKVLMFAEVQGVDLEDTQNNISLKAVKSGDETDAVLEYTKADMGFNHKVGKNKFGGNVAFTDGHVETIIMPTKMKIRDLTRYLCQGYDVPHDGRSYKPSDEDK